MGISKFIEARSFDVETKYGKISDSDRERLEFDIMLGRGEVIAGTGGLKQIRCGLGGCYGKKHGWQVVFASYYYPEYSVTFLLIRFPDKYIKDLSRYELKKLKEAKKRIDLLMDLKYGKEK